METSVSVLTLGVFDSFHLGHLHALRKASKHVKNGGNFIVGIQSDRAVIKQKLHETIASENERCKIVEAMKIVSKTFLYNNIDDIAHHDFDIFAHCEDLNKDTLYSMKALFPLKIFVSFPRFVKFEISSTIRRPARTTNNLKIAVDFHDTFTAHPIALTSMLKAFKRENIFILTGTPASRTNVIFEELSEKNVPFNKIIGGFEYETVEKNHFQKMAKWKCDALVENNIDIFVDDNPFYVSYVKDRMPNIMILQNILSKQYLQNFEGKHVDFTANLQSKQFDFLL
jgi:cytidyltransferase-like protein